MALLRGLANASAQARNRQLGVQPVAPTIQSPQPLTAPPSPAVAPPAPISTISAPTTIRPMQTQHPLLRDGGIMDIVDKWDQRPERSREGGTNGYMHVSSLIGLICTRRATLISQSDYVATEAVTGGHRLMWAQGRATEAHIREAVIGSTDGSVVYGNWKCRCGKAAHRGFRPAFDNRCHTCGHALDQYGEIVLMDHEHRITGSCDLSLIPDNKVLVAEIKSMTPEQFDALTAPLPDHCNQALMYREMYRRSGYAVHDHVVILYGRKQFRWGGGNSRKPVYKEFRVRADTAQARNMVDTCYATALEIARHNAARSHPERTKCQDATCKTAKSCPVAHLCFSIRG